MIQIAKCESGIRQFDKDGNVLRGRVNPKDKGIFQINTYYHLESAQNLGIDIFTIKGNIDYAEYLYDTQGTQPWIHSKPCWGSHLALY